MSAGPMRYCPICGAVNPSDAERCVSCRRVLTDREPPAAPGSQLPLASPDQPAQPGPITWNDPFGGVPQQGTPYGYGQERYGDGGYGGHGQVPYPSYDYGTQPPDQTAYDPYGAYGVPTEAYGYAPAAQPQPPVQPQAYAAQDDAPPPPPPSEPARSSTAPRQPLPPPIRRESGRGGCLMGCFAGLIIGALAAIFLGLFIVQPLLENEVGGELERVVGTQVAQQIAPADGTPDLTAGTYTISAAEITAELRRNADGFGPIDAPELVIDPNGLELRFDAFGRQSSYRGGVDVEDGRIVLTDVDASGLAARVLSADDAQEIIEDAFNGYIADAGLSVAAVELGEGELTITTTGQGIAATPVAAATPGARGTPRAVTPSPTPTATSTPTPRAIARPTRTPDDEAAVADATTPPRTGLSRPSPTRTPTPDDDSATAENTPPGDGTGL